MKYSLPNRVDHIDNYHGTNINDPYRYMEDADHEWTKKFVEVNNRLTDEFLEKDKINYYKEKLAKALLFDKFSIPKKRGNNYFYWKKDGIRSQPVVYRREGLHGKDTAIIDINEFSEDGTTAAIYHSPSPDGSIYAMSLSVHGSDWKTIYMKNIDKGQVLETLEWVTFPEMDWKKDNSGFYYGRYPDQNTIKEEDKRKFLKIYFHQINTSQDDDQLIYDPKNKELRPHVSLSHDGKYLFIAVYETTLPENKLLYKKIDTKEFKSIVAEFDGNKYIPLGLVSSSLYVVTSWKAPYNRVMRIDLDNPQKDNWVEIIPEDEHLLQEVKVINNQLVTLYQNHVKHNLKVYDLDGKFIQEIQLPTQGSLSTYDIDRQFLTASQDDTELFFGFTNFLFPLTIYHYNFLENTVNKYFNSGKITHSDQFEIKQIFYESIDKTKIPMYVIHKKELEIDGNNPTFLYGYGGYNVSIMPAFQPFVHVMLNEGWVFAQANIRGGGEYGKEWHEQALLGKKQMVFNDFIAAAEWLIENKYCSNSKLVINGRSNGGLLVGACLVQRPDLFAAAVPQVGVLDLLRYPFQDDAGKFWVKEYGNAQKFKEHFDFLIKISPYHNVRKDIEYPPTLITAAESDDRVSPMHSKKFAAEIQYAQEGDNPILLRIETKAGHGFGKTTTQVIEDYSIMFAFLSQVLNL